MVDYTIDPTGLPDIGPISGDDQRTLGGYVGRAAVRMAGAPTGLYAFASDVLKGAANATVAQDGDGVLKSAGRAYLKYMTPAGLLQGSGFDGLPGADAASDITDSIDKAGDEFGNKLAGRTLQPGLVNGNPLIDKVGTAIDTVGSLLPITGGPIMDGFKALKNINTGIKAIDKTVPIAAEIAAFTTPLIPTDSARAVIAGNALIGGAVQVADDVLSQPAPNNKAPDPAFDAVIDDFMKGTNKGFDQLDQHSSLGSDIAVDGVGKVSDVHDAVKPVQADILGVIPDEYKGWAAAAFGIGVAAGSAWMHRDVVRGKSLEWLGGKAFSSDTKLDFLTKPDDTNLSVADVAKTQAVNAATPLMRNSSDPEHMQALFENVGAAKDVHFTSLLDDGKFANSRITLNAPMSEFVDNMRNVISADPAKLQSFKDTANAIDELGNRNRAWLQDVSPPGLRGVAVDNPRVTAGYNSFLGSGGDELKYAFNMNDVKYGDLSSVVKNGLADPDVKSAIDAYTDITNKALQYRVEQGANTLREYNDMMKAHPQYFPTRQEASHMAPRVLSEGAGRLAPGDPVKELFPYLEQTVREVAESKLRTAFIMEAKANNASFIGKELPRDSKNVKNMDKVVSYRDYDANPKLIEVSDPMVRYALSPGAGSAAIRLSRGVTGAITRILGFPSRVLETTTTHPLTALIGSPFSPVAMTYGIGAVSANKQKGMVAGWADKWLQDHGAAGWRGDPTFAAQTLMQAGANVTAKLAMYGGTALSTIPHGSWLSKSMAGSTLDKLGQAMSNHYKASMLYETKQQGLHGGAHWMNQAATYTMKDLENALTPATRASEGWKAVSNFIWDLSRAVADAPQVSYYKQNKGRINQELLTTRARNVMGDPSKTGLGTSAFGAGAIQSTAILPWGGVTLQTFSRLLESARDNPVGTALAITNLVAIPSVLASNWNVRLGSEYVDYQHNVRTPDKVAGSIYVGIPGRPPEEGLEIPIDQPVRPFKVLTDTVWGHLHGLYDGSVFKQGNENLRKAMADGVATRYGIWGDAMHSAVSQILPAVPPVLNMINAAAGQEQIQSMVMPGQNIPDKNKNAGASDSTSHTIDNKWFGYPVSANLEATMQNTMGQVGQAIYEMLTAHFQGKKDGLTASDQFSDYQDRFWMRLGNATREVSGLWGHAATLSPSQEASAKTLTEQMDGMRKLDAASVKLRGLNGNGDLLSGAKGRQIDVLAGSGPVKFADQQMQALAFDAQRFVSVYDRQFSGRLKDLYEQRASILSSEKVAPDTKQTMMNDNAKQIVDVNRQALSALEQWKWNVSKAYNRDIDPRKMQLDQPITQFKPLLAGP